MDRTTTTIITPILTIAAAYSSLDINGDGVYWLAEIGVSSHLYRMLPYIITLDLQGNGIDEQTDEGGVLYQELKPQRRSFTAADGTVYTLRHEMLAAQVISDDGTVLYSEPAWANVLKPLLMLAALYVIFAAGYIALDRFATLEATGHLGQA